MRKIPQPLSENLINKDFVGSINIQDKPIRIPAQELHKYVLGLVGVFLLMVITYPIAMNRVSQTKKFAPYKSHLKSLTLKYQPSEPNQGS
jgi:hypothetical protein